MSFAVPYSILLHHPYKNDILLGFGSNFIVLDSINGNVKVTIGNESEVNKNISSNTSNAHIVDACFSSCGTYLAVAYDSKQIKIWTTIDYKIQTTFSCAKRVTSMVFSKGNSSKIIVSDKFGDVYLFTLGSNQSEGSLLLGHLSLITDVKLSIDEKYIISADRDEKIRISLFSHPFLIESFCLGHTSYVTRLANISPSCFASGGGDGRIILWDIQSGKAICSIDLENDVLQQRNVILPQFNPVSQCDDEPDNRYADETFQCRRPIRVLQNIQVNGDSFLVVSLEQSSYLFLFRVSQENLVFHSMLNTESEILGIAYHESTISLFVTTLTDSCPIMVYRFTDSFILDKQHPISNFPAQITEKMPANISYFSELRKRPLKSWFDRLYSDDVSQENDQSILSEEKPFSESKKKSKKPSKFEFWKEKKRQRQELKH